MNLFDFINKWEDDYNQQIVKIDLFDNNKKEWSLAQKQYFAKIFYHVRGHFHDFLWYVGNHATDKFTKEVILKNIAEELNGSAKSHEEMYFEFADSLDVSVKDEFVTSKNYLESIKKFNHGHLEWLHNHDSDERFGAFSAYEKLDNIDYNHLLKLVQALNVNSKGQIFFKVHAKVEHFEPTVQKLSQIWGYDNKKIIDSFDFIGYHQLNMWKQLSNEVFSIS